MNAVSNPLNRLEITILRLIAKGYNATAIGRYLHLQPRTIHRHFTQIKAKMECKTLEQVLFIAGRENLLGEYQPGDEI